MTFANEDEFLMYFFKRDEKVTVDASTLQNRLIKANTDKLEIARLKKQIDNLEFKNMMLKDKLGKDTYTLNLSA